MRVQCYMGQVGEWQKKWVTESWLLIRFQKKEARVYAARVGPVLEKEAAVYGIAQAGRELIYTRRKKNYGGKQQHKTN